MLLGNTPFVDVDKPNQAYASDMNIFELDHNLWNVLATLAYQDPELAKEQFNVSEKFIKFLRNVRTTHLKALSSGVLLSFKPNVTERVLLDKISKEYDSSHLSTMSVNSLASSYWLSVKQMTHKSIPFTSNAFDLSPEFLNKVNQATNGHMHHFALHCPARFALRSTEQTIMSIVNSISEDNPFATAPLLLKKIQQSMTN